MAFLFFHPEYLAMTQWSLKLILAMIWLLDLTGSARHHNPNHSHCQLSIKLSHITLSPQGANKARAKSTVE